MEASEYYARLRELKGRASRKVGNNTYLESEGKDTFLPPIYLRLHATRILAWRPDGTIRLNTGGWLTVTTKERMNRYLPGGIKVASDTDGMWAVYRLRAKNPNSAEFSGWGFDGRRYFDGMVISEEGEVLNPQARPGNIDRTQLVADIKNYARRCGEERPEPNDSDCFLCSMAFDGDCLASHLEEGYVHGSLILRALKAKGYVNPYLIMQIDSDGSMIASAVRRLMSAALIPERAPLR